MNRATMAASADVPGVCAYLSEWLGSKKSKALTFEQEVEHWKRSVTGGMLLWPVHPLHND